MILRRWPIAGSRSLCCGSGGMAPAVAPALAKQMTEARLAEARFDLVTYCASCRARLTAAGRPSLHLLELIFNPHWRQAIRPAPAGSKTRWFRRWRLEAVFGEIITPWERGLGAEGPYPLSQTLSPNPHIG